jgi:hypothetical protein
METTKMGIGDVSHEIDDSGGRFWKRLRFAENCNARRNFKPTLRDVLGQPTQEA